MTSLTGWGTSMYYCFLLIPDGFIQTRFYYHEDAYRSAVMGPRGIKMIVPRDDILDVWEA